MAMDLKATLNKGLSGLVDLAIGKVVGFVASIFGKSQTKKAIAAMQTNANALLINEQKQNQTLKYVLYGFLALAGAVLFFFILRKRK